MTCYVNLKKYNVTTNSVINKRSYIFMLRVKKKGSVLFINYFRTYLLTYLNLK